MKNNFSAYSAIFYFVFSGLVFLTGCNKKEEIESSTTVQLSGTAEVPPINSPASGTVTATYNRDTKLLTYQLAWQGLTNGSADANVLNLNTIALSGANEVPAINSPGTGTLTGSYNLQTNVLAYRLQFGGLTGGGLPTMMHFHGPAAAGANAGVQIGINPFPLITVTPFNGTATLTDAQELDLLAGRWYYNLHTNAFPGGELRGQLSFVGVPLAMHFHGPAATTANAGVQIGITGFPMRTTGSHTGTTVALTPEQEADLLGGRWYFNLHTTNFPGGELRGQLFAQ
jgi:CHRD domain